MVKMIVLHPAICSPAYSSASSDSVKTDSQAVSCFYCGEQQQHQASHRCGEEWNVTKNIYSICCAYVTSFSNF